MIEGSGTSKNWIQAKIKAAKNYPGSPVASVTGGGDALDIADAETPPRKEQAEVEDEGFDPMDDIPF